jgi:mRNA interferase MazF
MRLAEAPGNIILPRNISKLPKDSVINLSQIITLDKSFLSERVGKLSSKKLPALDDGLRLVFSL